MSVDRLVIEIVGDSVQFKRELKSVEGDLARFNQKVQVTDNQLRKLNTAQDVLIGGFRGAVVALSSLQTMFYQYAFFLGGFTSQVIKSGAELQKLTYLMRGLSTATTETGKAMEAADNVNFIRNMAKEAPYSLSVLSDAFTKLKVGGIEPTNGSLQALIDTAARFGKSGDDISRGAVAIQQMASKGVISMEELRQQLAEAVPTAFEDMANALGVSTVELNKKIGDGVVDSKIALAALFREWEIQNKGAAKNLMNTWDGQLSILKTSFFDFANTINGFDKKGDAVKGGFFDTMTQTVKELSGFLASADGKTFAKDLGEGMTTALGAVTSVVKILYEWKDVLGFIVKIGVTAFLAKLTTGLIASGLQGAASLTNLKNGFDRLRNINLGGSVTQLNNISGAAKKVSVDINGVTKEVTLASNAQGSYVEALKQTISKEESSIASGNKKEAMLRLLQASYRNKIDLANTDIATTTQQISKAQASVQSYQALLASSQKYYQKQVDGGKDTTAAVARVEAAQGRLALATANLDRLYSNQSRSVNNLNASKRGLISTTNKLNQVLRSAQISAASLTLAEQSLGVATTGLGAKMQLLGGNLLTVTRNFIAARGGAMAMMATMGSFVASAAGWIGLIVSLGMYIYDLASQWNKASAAAKQYMIDARMANAQGVLMSNEQREGLYSSLREKEKRLATLKGLNGAPEMMATPTGISVIQSSENVAKEIAKLTNETKELRGAIRNQTQINKDQQRASVVSFQEQKFEKQYSEALKKVYEPYNAMIANKDKYRPGDPALLAARKEGDIRAKKLEQDYQTNLAKIASSAIYGSSQRAAASNLLARTRDSGGMSGPVSTEGVFDAKGIDDKKDKKGKKAKAATEKKDPLEGKRNQLIANLVEIQRVSEETQATLDGVDLQFDPTAAEEYAAKTVNLIKSEQELTDKILQTKEALRQKREEMTAKKGLADLKADTDQMVADADNAMEQLKTGIEDPLYAAEKLRAQLTEKFKFSLRIDVTKAETQKEIDRATKAEVDKILAEEAAKYKEQSENIAMSLMSTDELRQYNYDKEMQRLNLLEAAAIRVSNTTALAEIQKYKKMAAERDKYEKMGALGQWALEAKDVGQSINESFTGALDNFTNDLAEGKASFKDFAKSIIADITRIILKALIAQAIMAAIGAITGQPVTVGGGNANIFSGLFGGGSTGFSSSAMTSTLNGLGNALPGIGAGGSAGFGGWLPSNTVNVSNAVPGLGQVFTGNHTGGIVGREATFTRAMSAATFDFANRFHTGGIAGLQPNEVPIIAEKGEGIFTEGQMKALGKGSTTAGNMTANVQVNVINQTTNEVSAEQSESRFDGESYIVDVVLKNMSKPGPIRDGMKGMR